MLVLLSLIACVGVQALVVDYPASQMGLGWIQIALRHTDPVQVQRVHWCRSGVANGADPPPPDIAECTASNLQHLQLYPSTRVYLRDPPEAEPNTLYIDADDLGGWDTRHQFDIIIEGNKGVFRQVVRFNALPPTTTSETLTSETLTSSEVLTSSEATSEVLTSSEVITTFPALVSHHPWLGSGIFLGSGLLLITLVTLLLRWRQTRQQQPGPLALATRYAWNEAQDTVLLPPPGALIEMQDMSQSTADFEEDE